MVVTVNRGAVIPALITRAHNLLTVMDTELGKTAYLAGDEPTIADISRAICFVFLSSVSNFSGVWQCVQLTPSERA